MTDANVAAPPNPGFDQPPADDLVRAPEGKDVTLTKHDRRSAPTPDESRLPAHAHAHDSAALPNSPQFPHARLDAYRVALEMARTAKGISEKIPRGNRSVADHLLRAATNTVLLLAEGANRRGCNEKRQRFVESRGECAEVAAAADLLVVLGMGEQAEVERMSRLANRVSAMLTKLIARLG